MMNNELEQTILEWASSTTPTQPPDNFYCPTRDVFQARLDTLRILLEKKRALKNSASLLTAIVGEIGNNAFDHNIGNWQDIVGVYFSYDFDAGVIVCADRGQGILATLQKIRPTIATDEEAVRVAFTEKLSGRAPENRGNGLKFVRSVIGAQQWHLEMRSGEAQATINQGFTIKKNDLPLPGCVVGIRFL